MEFTWSTQENLGNLSQDRRR